MPLFPKTYVYKTPLLCNAACAFCVSQSTQTHKYYKYPTIKIVSDLLKIKKMWFDTIVLVGGEPTIIENLHEFLRTAQKIGLDVIVTTNGIIFSDFEYIKAMNDAGLKNIIFSIHSNKEEIHDMLVGIPGAHKKILQAIKNAQSLNFSHISTSTVICKQNEDSLVDIIHFIRENTGITINNFCNLEVNKIDIADYEKKSFLFPSLQSIQKEITRIHKEFPNSWESIGIQNLPLCAFTEETLFLTHETQWTERYYEPWLEKGVNSPRRIHGMTCKNCRLDAVCKWYFPYFQEKDLRPF